MFGIMKKLIVILLCCAMLAGCLEAIAEGIETEEIEIATVDEAVPEETEYTIGCEEEAKPGNGDNGFAIDSIADTTILNKYDGPGGHVDIPYGIRVIGMYAFRDRTDITGVTIPSTVYTIEDYAFFRSGIEKIIIPGSVTQIGCSAFSECNNAKSLEILEGSETLIIGSDAFESCKELNSVSIAPRNTIIMEVQDTFHHCPALESVTIGYGLKTIPDHAFDGCKSLKVIDMPDGITVIGRGAFIDCEHLENLSISNGVEEIKEYAFYRCKSLKSIRIPDSVMTIGPAAFAECESLEEVTFSKNLKTIDYCAFQDTSIKSVTLYDGLEVIARQAFDGCTLLTQVTIPGTVKTIETFAFNECTSLEKVILGEGLNTLEACCFYGCTALCKVKIPASVKKIGSMALGMMTLENGITGQPVPGFVIHGKAGSEAERYANDNNIEFDDGTIKPKNIKITNGTSAELQVGKTLQLKTKLLPTNAKTTLTWKSSDNSAAKVSKKGLVTAVKKGTATVTVTTKNGKTASIKIKVVAQKPRKVEITNGKKATLEVGKKLKLKIKLTPEGAETKLSWKSSDKRIATVDKNGVVTAKKAGTAKITVSTSNGKTAKITIKVIRK